jgi:hypothetical protein
MAPGWRPPFHEVAQSCGLCCTAVGGIVLVALRPKQWNPPGGTIEQSESREEAVVREIGEEACATVLVHCSIASPHMGPPAPPRAAELLEPVVGAGVA